MLKVLIKVRKTFDVEKLNPAGFEVELEGDEVSCPISDILRLNSHENDVTQSQAT